MPLLSALNKSFIYDGAGGSKAQREKLRRHMRKLLATTDFGNALHCNQSTHVLHCSSSLSASTDLNNALDLHSNQTHVLPVLPLHIYFFSACLSEGMMLHLLTTYSQPSQREREDLRG